MSTKVIYYVDPIFCLYKGIISTDPLRPGGDLKLTLDHIREFHATIPVEVHIFPFFYQLGEYTIPENIKLIGIGDCRVSISPIPN